VIFSILSNVSETTFSCACVLIPFVKVKVSTCLCRAYGLKTALNYRRDVLSTSCLL